jgi:hypothetical protein
MGKLKDTLYSPDPAIRWLGPYPPHDPTEEEMTGYRSKKASAASRHADDITVQELVRLRVENDNLKKELGEARLCSCQKQDLVDTTKLNGSK